MTRIFGLDLKLIGCLAAALGADILYVKLRHAKVNKKLKAEIADLEAETAALKLKHADIRSLQLILEADVVAVITLHQQALDDHFASLIHTIKTESGEAAEEALAQAYCVVVKRKKREDEALLESRERKIAAGWHVLVSDDDSFAMSMSKAKQAYRSLVESNMDTTAAGPTSLSVLS